LKLLYLAVNSAPGGLARNARDVEGFIGNAACSPFGYPLAVDFASGGVIRARALLKRVNFRQGPKPGRSMR
jgi:hypothetical protein